MAEDNTQQSSPGKRKSRDTYLIAGAFILMITAIITIWQFLLKGKTEEDKALNRDTVIQVKTDTVKLIDSIKQKNTHSTQTINSTEDNINKKNDSVKTGRTEKLSEEDKARLKEEFKELPKSKQDKLKRKLKTSLNK